MADFKKTIIELNGGKGRAWLENLNFSVNKLAEEWNLSALRPFQNLTFNYVLAGFQNETPIVLKIGLKSELLKKEAEGLKFFKNFGAAELLNFSLNLPDSSNNISPRQNSLNGNNILLKNPLSCISLPQNFSVNTSLQENSFGSAILLKKYSPGTSLMELLKTPFDESFPPVQCFTNREQEAIRINASIIKKLHSAPQIPNTFLSLEDLLHPLFQNYAIPEKFLKKARSIANYLIKTTTQRIVMHGDLHPDNIIRDSDTWKTIDPSPVVGDPVYELASFMINPIDKLWKYKNAKEILQNRADEFSKILNLNSERILQWSFVKSVLCLIWTINLSDNNRREIAELFDHVVPVL